MRHQTGSDICAHHATRRDADVTDKAENYALLCITTSHNWSDKNLFCFSCVVRINWLRVQAYQFKRRPSEVGN